MICVIFFRIQRYLNHLSQFIDAIHILCSKRISQHMLETAERLLTSFSNNFEILYGESNVVFNIHLARHLVDCVKFLGPLFTYSNYCFEDQIGHLISLQKGTTDVATQICGKYLIGKNLVQILPNSRIASNFFNEISSKHKFPISHNVDGSVVIGKPRDVCENLPLIFGTLNLEDDVQVSEYSSVLFNSNIFYEIVNRGNKRTDDSFIFNVESGKFGIIESILVIENKIYFLVIEKFEKIQNQNQLMSIVYLRETEQSHRKIIETICVGPKFAFIKFDDIIACSEFPNMFERN